MGDSDSPGTSSRAQESLTISTSSSPERSAATLRGQQKVNLIWEFTQAAIAVLITMAIVTASIMVLVTGKGEIPNILCAGFGLVVGTYFQRTNHIKIGGVGYKPPYEER
jgi:hypothetical protein